MNNKIWTEGDLLNMVRDKSQESIHLDFKACEALNGLNDKKKEKLSIMVSSFANSDGGTIIYGIIEENHVASRVDNGFNPDEISKETIENVITSTIFKRISGLIIHPVHLETSNPGRYAYIIEIPVSSDAPHMAADKRYHKRQNFKSCIMEHYEIEDVRNRKGKALISAKLTIESDMIQGQIASRIALYATASTNTITDTYSIILIVEENAMLNSRHFTLLDDHFYSERHGRAIFGSVYQRIVSPSFGHPIWKGHEINLFERYDRLNIDYKGTWKELLVISELYIPGESEPLVNKIKITNNNGAIGYKYSHEEPF